MYACREASGLGGTAKTVHVFCEVPRGGVSLDTRVPLTRFPARRQMKEMHVSRETNTSTAGPQALP